MKVWEHPEYAGFAEELNDPEVQKICADWLDDHGFEDAAKHYRGGMCPLDVLKEYDWKEAFGFAGEVSACNHEQNISPAHPDEKIPCWPFGVGHVKKLIASSEGENDGPSWLALGELWDGRYFALKAGCDYTGWD